MSITHFPYIGCDAHKKYSVFSSMNEKGQYGTTIRVPNNQKVMRLFLSSLQPKSQIAVESIGSWYWLIDEMEQIGHKPLLVNPRKAKQMMGQMNKTDKLDSRALALLNRNGTLPVVWTAPKEIRDQRELMRMRMAFVRTRTLLKNRVHALLAKYNIEIDEVTDLFGVKGRQLLEERSKELPFYSQQCLRQHLEMLEQVGEQIKKIELQLEQILEETPTIQLLRTIPGVGKILATVIAWEIGSIDRFGSPECLASYAGTVPRVRSSGGKTYYGQVRSDTNRYLKWGLIEAANGVVLRQHRLGGIHVVRLYDRIRKRRGHAKAVVAVARHLAEACYWVLKKSEAYKEPYRRAEPMTSMPKENANLA